jgi:hypothetical protein
MEHWNGSQWMLMSSPSVDNSQLDYLFAATSTSANNAWAVGSYTDSNNATKTLTEHWNGSTWTIVSSPNPNSNNNQLSAVAAFSASNIWAVGSYSSGNSTYPLIEHYC